MLSQQEAVLAANASFYAAFCARDVAAMDELWARNAPIACIHPGWAALHGRSSVMQSWEGIMRGPSPPEIRCGESSAFVNGSSAFVICTEHLADGDLVATNVFILEGAEWKLVHHQAGPAPPAPRAPRESLH